MTRFLPDTHATVRSPVGQSSLTDIDRRAAEQLKKIRPMIDQVGPDKHQEILVQA